MLKTHNCNDLRAAHIGHKATLAGWVNRRRDHGGLIFIDLRDCSGIVQIVMNPDVAAEAHAEAVAKFAPRNPYWMETCPEAAFIMILGTK